MNKLLKVSRQTLEEAKTADGYLQVLLDKYNEVWRAAPDELLENFSEEQISFLMYGVLYNQVQNGGFLQLLFNGYAPYIFGSPLSQDLRRWGADALANLLDEVKEDCLKTAEEIGAKEKTLEALSQSYGQYPKFNEYDARFSENDGTAQVKAYVESHLSDFIKAS